MVSSFWSSYLRRLLPGWPEYPNLLDYCLSLSFVFLCTFSAEFCSKLPTGRPTRLRSVVMRAVNWFMLYLAIVAVTATDLVFLFVAVAGHAVGDFVAALYFVDGALLKLPHIQVDGGVSGLHF